MPDKEPRMIESIAHEWQQIETMLELLPAPLSKSEMDLMKYVFYSGAKTLMVASFAVAKSGLPPAEIARRMNALATEINNYKRDAGFAVIDTKREH